MQTIESGFNLLGSHDTTRVLSYCNNNKDKFKLAYLFMLLNQVHRVYTTEMKLV